MMKVKATNKSTSLCLAIKELGRIANEGEEFEIEEDRLPILMGNNPYKAQFVDVVKENKEDKPKRKKKVEE